MREAELKNRLIELVDQINQRDRRAALVFHQQSVIKRHMSISGRDGKMWVTPRMGACDVSLSGQSITTRLTPYMETLFGRPCDGYKQRNANKGWERQPYWTTKDFSPVVEAVTKYSTLTF